MPLDPGLTHDAVVALYSKILEAWNSRDAEQFAAQFTDDGSTIGFDGSQLDGRKSIASELSRIFDHHVTATYVGKVHEIRALGSSAMLLRAVAGMIPPEKSELMPERNAVQSLIAVMEGGSAKVALYQNTPARFDGRLQLVEQMTQELSEVLRSGQIVDAR